jgi:hypothetical protein
VGWTLGDSYGNECLDVKNVRVTGCELVWLLGVGLLAVDGLGFDEYERKKEREEGELADVVFQSSQNAEAGRQAGRRRTRRTLVYAGWKSKQEPRGCVSPTKAKSKREKRKQAGMLLALERS